MDNKKRICSMFVLMVLFLLHFSALLFSQSIDQVRKNFTRARDIKYSQMDSSLFYFEKSRQDFLVLGDTLMAIKCLLESSVVNTTKADYSKSYDGYWEALSLSEGVGSKELAASACDGLGTLYGLFYRHEKALAYYRKSLAIRKKLVEQGDIALTELLGTYYLMAINFREQQKISTAQQYLDTCYQIRKAYPSKTVYIDAEQGYLYYYQNRLPEAERILTEVEKSFLSANESYLVILYSFMGDLYNKMNDFDKSSYYYLQSLEAAKKYRSHQNYVPEVYKKLGDLYMSVHKSRQAYFYLTKSFNANDSLFGARSDNNRRFIEIKDQFRREQEEQQKLLEKARLTKLENEKRILFLRNSVLTIVLIFLVLISFFALLYLKHRHKTAEQILKSEQKAKEEKNKEILEVKNKELTSSALQLIEKDELLIEIKNRLNAVKNKDLRDLIAKINANSKHDWKEFDTRFTAVNQGFYKSLSERFPDLTQRDHKLCALIKLNFSSKEMSLLLGISIESVHTSRYRLRQKLKLDKGENLTEFIAKV
ncbi:tetratricopeptide repeat protein [Saccharicrinis fermentans]|uniref:ATP-dependent transcriptional regulator n=1 Tax=Saccharicrinis fermentans DSM 9555 = JCM 21142 TaxID=869213 RepID=W7Y6W6_9BACT|nr:tetratricopeptide repeat protein [Saccharicrinis fermentans]GAF03403.1 ATP-dependent transcriptional regulator [Saccharicrinis fermentans DSM 9555 = JCM 21142]